MRLNRELQLEIMRKLTDAYPNGVRDVLPADSAGEETLLVYAANLIYLDQHGLINAGTTKLMDGGYRFGVLTATQRGMDFMADDGGLSAILGVVTVRLHADTMRDLLVAKIDGSDISPGEKDDLKHRLSRLSGEALKEASKFLIQQGIQQLPDAVQWLEKLLS